MSLVSGPGRGGGSIQLPDEASLVIEKHVDYIKSLDTVRVSAPNLHAYPHR